MNMYGVSREQRTRRGGLLRQSAENDWSWDSNSLLLGNLWPCTDVTWSADTREYTAIAPDGTLLGMRSASQQSRVTAITDSFTSSNSSGPPSDVPLSCGDAETNVLEDLQLSFDHEWSSLDVSSNLSTSQDLFSSMYAAPGATPPSGGQKRRIKPTDQPFERPKRKQKVLQFCSVQGCGKAFTCFYDLKRHSEDVHGGAKWVYRCDDPACGYRRPRKDKVRDHCTKRKHPGFSEFFVGQGRNADELAAMLEQRRKKGMRRSACKSCGRSG